MNRIFVIEDDENLRNQMKEILSGYGYEVILVQDFLTIEKQFEEAAADMIILDINLPYYDGNYYCRIFRRQSRIPIIITSARNTDMDQILSMELGADDYVVKPFSIPVLITKINALMRRVYGEYSKEEKKKEKPEKMGYGGLTLEESSFKIRYKGMERDLSKNEYRLAKIFLKKPETVLSREELLEALWDQSDFVDDNTLTVNITRLRGKLAELGLEDVIRTKRGVGYLLEVKEGEKT